jgi:hypothetical protein
LVLFFKKEQAALFEKSAQKLLIVGVARMAKNLVSARRSWPDGMHSRQEGVSPWPNLCPLREGSAGG